jgi:EKC/KEOPS complex subunit CGI121/TPRKB
LLVIKVSTPSAPIDAEAVRAHLEAEIEGEMVRFEDEVSEGMTDLGRVRKVYKLNSGGGGGGKKGIEGLSINRVGKEQEERKELEVMVLGAMALRGATN